MLTDRGSCFTADGFERACQKPGVIHRTTRPYTPRTNGMVERFNGRVQREVLGITIASHPDLETLLRGFNQAYNARRQRVLKGRSLCRETPKFCDSDLGTLDHKGEGCRKNLSLNKNLLR